MITKFKLFEHKYGRSEEYKYLDPEVEKDLKEYLYDDIIDIINKTIKNLPKDFDNYVFNYYELRPWANISLQSKAKNYLNNKNEKSSNPEFLNSLNRIVDEILDENYNYDEIIDNELIKYFKIHQQEWLDIKSLYDFSDNVKQHLAYISKAKDFNI